MANKSAQTARWKGRLVDLGLTAKTEVLAEHLPLLLESGSWLTENFLMSGASTSARRLRVRPFRARKWAALLTRNPFEVSRLGLAWERTPADAGGQQLGEGRRLVAGVGR